MVNCSEGLSSTWINFMSVSGEFMHLSDDFIVMTANIDDCPCVKIPLTELFDVATFTLIDNYLEVFYQYVVELLEDTAWMDLQSFSRLLRAGYNIYHPIDTGEILAMPKPALQRLFLQNLRRCNDYDEKFEVPLLINFLMPDSDLPRPLVPRSDPRNIPTASIRHHYSQAKQLVPPADQKLSALNVNAGSLWAMNSSQWKDHDFAPDAAHDQQQDDCQQMPEAHGTRTIDIAAGNGGGGDTRNVFVHINKNNLICEAVDRSVLMLGVPFAALTNAWSSPERSMTIAASHGLFNFADISTTGDPTAKVANLRDDPFDHDMRTGGKDFTPKCVGITTHAGTGNQSADSKDDVISRMQMAMGRNRIPGVPSQLQGFDIATPMLFGTLLTDKHDIVYRHVAAVEPRICVVVPTDGNVLMTAMASDPQDAFNNQRHSIYAIGMEMAYTYFTIAGTSYNDPLQTGGDGGQYHPLPPSLLTRYQPFDRGRCHPTPFLD
jgi:hypothetical protein